MKKAHAHFRLTTIATAMIQAALLTPSLVSAAPPPGMTAANANTSVTLAPNGVPLVNIATPNAAGLSHNQYTQFNVDSRGAVLNNVSASQVSQTSQLAGQVYANPNLNNAAHVILNEVVAPNRSQLNGYLEVAGGKADVVVANPFGITCNGCGFINTDRASLTTGTPMFGADGGLSGFQVNGGDVLISGAGLDGKNQSYFDIVTRSVKLDGQVNAGDLNITTGPGTWNYASRTSTASAPSGAAPDYAFDSTALGGMYANKIKIVANEAGVGVRMLGDAAATGSDFSIDAAGKIQLSSHVSAQGDIAAHTSAMGADALTVSGANASLAAHGNIDLAAANGGVTLTDGSLAADGGLTISATSLTDSSTMGATRFAGKDASVNVSGAASMSGTAWGAGGSFGVNAGSLALGSNTKLYSGTDSTAAN
ncbi:MAG TPA: filamentous hemagglutinin N-terminal domain-containing protein, partial [Rhodocyclaceae bacterium]|nr:filamentous hemagglutinin N-terminal domain-containing protein [Rhodocyclaceae bacterium]